MADSDLSMDQSSTAPRRDWTNTLFLTASHAMAVAAVVYLVFNFSWLTVGLGVLWFVCCGMSITGGYHRLFSHRAYKAGWLLRAWYLFFGAASVQNSALRWCADHRVHHARTDTDEDPYNIGRGFWWAHVGWVLHKGQGRDMRLVKDLAADPLVRFQDRFYIPLAIVAGVLVPMGIASFWGDAIGALFVVGFLRLVVQWHATFAVNSFAHMLGTRPFCKRSSARDSFWVALMTLGEGYHNFHHRFPVDYRNGIKWYHFDPTKWFVWGASFTRLTWDLRRTSGEKIQAARESVRARRQPPQRA